MRIEIFAIGGEIVSGLVVNSNAAYLSRILTEEGWEVLVHTALPDQKKLLASFLKNAWQRSDCLLLTGGLGPTHDDVTRTVLAEMFASPLEFNPEVAKDLEKRYGAQLQSLRDQATVPSKAKILRNEAGTAPGLLFEEEEKCLIAMPGVPSEMESIFQTGALPFLRKKWGSSTRKKHKKIHLCMLAESTVDAVLRRFHQSCPHVDVGIYMSYGFLTAVFTGEKEEDLIRGVRTVEEAFPNNVFSQHTSRIEEAIYALFVEKKWKLGVAESCTGGEIASRLTSVPGASHYFQGSIVSYSNEVKREVLRVPEEMLRNPGAVSKETAEAMAQGVLNLMDVDWALSVTGIAGPSGGTEEKPVGTVWIALAQRNHPPEAHHFKWVGSREKIMLLATHYALGMLWQRVAKGASKT